MRSHDGGVARVVDLARAEAVLLGRRGALGTWLVAVLCGALAIGQEPPFERQQGLDATWSSVAVWLALCAGGVLPWIWLSAHARPSSSRWIVRAPVRPASLVLGAWSGLVAVAALVTGAAILTLFTLDRILGHGVPVGRTAAAGALALVHAAALSAWALPLRWLEPALATRGVLWLVVLAAGAGAFGAGWPSAFRSRADGLALLLATAAGLLLAHALLLRRRALRN